MTGWHLVQGNPGRMIAPFDGPAVAGFFAELDRINANAAPGHVERWDGADQAPWWIEAGTLPSADDALARLWTLDRYGPTWRAFTFRARFPAPGPAGGAVDMQPDPWCVGTA